MVAEIFYDSSSGKEIALMFGITRYGSVAICRRASINLNSLSLYFGNSKAAVMTWQDDGDGIPESKEVDVLIRS